MDLAGDFGVVEVLPILEVIEVYGVKDGSGVGNADGLEDGSTGGVIVIVANHRSVVLIDGVIVERPPFLVQDPLLAFGVGRFAFLDVCEEGFALDTESVESHLVEAGTRGGVVAVKLAGGVERGFLPKTWQVKHAERASDSRGDERDNLAHVLGCFGFRLRGSQKSLATYR